MAWVWGNKGIDKILKLIYSLDLILGLRTNPGNVTLRIRTPSLPKIRYCLTYLEKINNKKKIILLKEVIKKNSCNSIYEIKNKK